MTASPRKRRGENVSARLALTPDELQRGVSEVFLTEDDLARRWKNRPKTLRNLRSAGQGPAYHKLGSSVRYALSDILQYEALAKRSAGR